MKRTILILSAAVLLLFLYGIQKTCRAADPPNIFGLEVGNTWTYQGTGNNGPYTARDEVAAKEHHNSRTVYLVKRRENGEWIETQWLERKSGKVKLWGGKADFDGKTCTMLFSSGLEQAWYPMQVGERRFSTTTLTIKEIDGYVFHASMRVDVVGKKRIDLSFGTVTAYKIRYQMRVWGKGADEATTFVQWRVPYLGYVKCEDQESADQLVSFSIGGRRITQDRDADKDGLKDYPEFWASVTD